MIVMIITNHSCNNNKTPLVHKIAQTSFGKCESNTVSFKGNIASEVLSGKRLKHETALFRDVASLEFVKNYLKETFPNKEKLKIIVGAASSGEESVTLSMLLDSLKKKAEILGFDLSENSVKQAKSRKYVLSTPTKVPEGYTNLYDSAYISAYDDAFLCFKQETPLTPKQKEYKKLFEDFFEQIETPDDKKPRISLGQKINNYILKRFLKIYAGKLENKYFKLKDDKALNCDFVKGDILELNKIVKEKEADVILFRNALYHLVTDLINNNIHLPKPKEEAASILEKVFKQIHKSLSKDGVFVLGANESYQTLDGGLTQEVLARSGFKPLSAEVEGFNSVWKKC